MILLVLTHIFKKHLVVNMYRFFVLFIFIISCFNLGFSQTKIYLGNTSNIVATWDGKYLYEGNSTYKSSIIYKIENNNIYTTNNKIVATFDNNKLYIGTSKYRSSIIYKLNKNILFLKDSNYRKDIIANFTNREIYKGNSNYRSNVLCRYSSDIPILVKIILVDMLNN